MGNNSLKIILSLDPIKYPLTGIGRYAYELAKSLSKNKRIDCLRFMQGNQFYESIPEAEQMPNMMSFLRRALQKNRFAVAIYQITSPRLKAWSLKSLKDHLYHGPNFYLPPFQGRSVVTIHDLSVYNWAGCHPPERVRYMKAEIKLSLKRASLLITDSDFIRQEVASQFSWPLDKIHAISLASAKSFFPQRAVEISSVLGKYRLSPNGYCLFSGTIEPRKNIDTLLDAYQLLPDSIKKKWPLVLTGYEGWNSKNLHKRIKEFVKAGWARYFGYVPSAHLPKIFAGARLFVFPSLYEGFGLPVLEAMASGVPVICSNSSSLPEVIGDAGAMCEALDTDTLSGLISVGLENEQWRKNAIKKGLHRAKQFSWKRCAKETIAAYEAALNL